MSDRTSAEIFREIFLIFAEEATVRDKEQARRLWGVAEEYDFHFEQMVCNEALVRLGLARRRVGGGLLIYEYADPDGQLR